MESSPLSILEEIHISVPWGHIAGRWYGRKDVRPLLAMHGWLDNSGTWDTLIPLLPPHIGVLSIDLPGHGNSSRLPPGIMYTPLNYVGIILRVMEEYSWDKVSLLGHSMSSVNSFFFTSFYPEKVDLLIQIDVIHQRNHTPEGYINVMKYGIENFLIEEKRSRAIDLNEPPSYTYEDLIQRMYDGSNKSIDKDKIKHIARTNVRKSTRFPAKYYFSRDGKLKHYHFGFMGEIEYSIFLAERIRVPHILIKGSDSDYIELDDPCLQVLRDNNPNFEFHIVKGTHHVHLNNPHGTCALLNPFINKWRPPPLPNEEKPIPQHWVNKVKKQRILQSKL